MDKPFIIAFCGIDGAGKTTQLEKTYNWLRKCGYKVKKTKPILRSLEVIYALAGKMYGDPYAFHPGIPPLIVRLGLAFDLAFHFQDCEKEYTDCDILLCDRHALCFRAYGMAYGVKDEWVDRIFSLVEEPDLIFYFDINIRNAERRIIQRTGKIPCAEEAPELLLKVMECYKILISKKNNVKVINSNLCIENVSAKINSIITKLVYSKN